jgi:hypothetical protein
MGCDYYIQTELIINYYDDKCELITVIANRQIEKGYIFSFCGEDSDDDYETANKKYAEELNRIIDKNTYEKILFENNIWVKKSYENKYLPELKTKCPNLVTLIKIYKDYTAWEKS